MTQRHIRKAEQSKEFDRETWADLAKITYKFLVKGHGDAVAGPFWFGRAYDAPPYFSFSAVAQSNTTADQMTIGVSEWLKDGEIYVGANLWISFHACTEPFPTGVVLNEGFEDIIKRQGGGPEGNEIICHGFLPGDTVNIDGDDLSAPVHAGWGWYSVQQDIGTSQDPFDPEVIVGALGFKPIKKTHDWVLTDNPKQVEYRQLQFGPTFPWWVYNPEFPSLATYDGIERPTGVGSETATFYARTNWHVVTDNPSTGTHHLRTEQPAFNLAAGDLFTSSRPILEWGYLLPCSHAYHLFDWYEGVTVEGTSFDVRRAVWRVAEDMTVRITFDAYISKYDVSSGFEDRINVFVAAWDQDGQLLYDANNPTFDPQPNPQSGSFSAGFSLATAEGTYRRFSTEATVIREDAHFLSARLAWDANARVSHGAYEAKFLDIDNLKFEIIGDQQPAQSARFDVDLNFEGRELKNYHNIHPIEPFSHPTEVVLS